MDNIDRLNLQKMISANDVEDCTQDIRSKKHSQLIKKDLMTLIELKTKHRQLEKLEPFEFENLCIENCKFLFNNYTDIFNKIRKDELDLDIFNRFIEILKMIEDGKLDQHEGAYLVGTILKKLYIDSALRKSQHLDEENVVQNKFVEPKKISWSQWKMTNNKQ